MEMIREATARSGRARLARLNRQEDLTMAGEQVIQLTTEQLKTLIQEATKAVVDDSAAANVAPLMTDPALANDEPWSHNQSQGIKICMAAISPTAPKFDGIKAKPGALLTAVMIRTETRGFTMMFCVSDASGTERNLIDECGCLTMNGVKAAATVNLRDTKRPHQAQMILNKMIKLSMEPEVLDRLVCEKDQFTRNVTTANTRGPNDTHQKDMQAPGTVVLKALIEIVAVETRATIATLLNRLDDLPSLMAESKSNVAMFSDATKRTCAALRARKIAPPMLITKLLLGCKSCEDATFGSHVERKEEGHLDGTLSLTDEKLMALALEKCKLPHDELKVWLKKSKEELEFIAMQNECKHALQQIKRDDKGGAAKQEKLDKGQDNKRTEGDPKWAWKRAAPKKGEPLEKEFEGKTHIHCPHHGDLLWVLKVNRKGRVHVENCKALKKTAASKDEKQDARQSALAGLMDNPDASGGNRDALVTDKI